MKIDKIAILGAGNLGLSIAKGLEMSGMITRDQLVLSEKNPSRKETLEAEGYEVHLDNNVVVKKASIIMVVVKPWQIEEVLVDIKETLNPKKHLLISCVTGATSKSVFDALGYELPFFRVMPNTGVAVQESMSCISNFNTTEEQKTLIHDMFSKLGQVLFVPESQMAAGTALAGCGIAFALRFIRAAMEAGVEIGFSAADANVMAAQIAKGAASLILENDSHPEVEIDKVTTPKGITITGLNEMEHAGFSSSVIQGILAAFNKVDN